jgi:predicted dehydrogenase
MKLRYGMIGGGPGSFIGAIHRKAAAMDARFELVCGAFSADPAKSRATGAELGVKAYATFTDMLDTEPDLDAVSIVTPNHVHVAPAMAALERGVHVILDKPMTFTLQEARDLKSLVDHSGLAFALTHTYAGYPMVKEMRHRIAAGEIGPVRKVFVEYPQGWLSASIETEGQKQAGWRTDPARSGAGGAVGDIGTHAAHLAEYVTGARITQVCAMMNAVVPGRALDDDAAAFLRFDTGATGVLVATQIASGEQNALRIRVYGTTGGFDWCHADPNTLIHKPVDGPMRLIHTGTGYVSAAAKAATRLPAGHPEGFIEAFANLYTGFADAIVDHKAGRFRGMPAYDVPSVDEGLRGMAFIDAMVASGRADTTWTDIPL